MPLEGILEAKDFLYLMTFQLLIPWYARYANFD